MHMTHHSGSGDCDECRVTIPEPYVCPKLAEHRSLSAASACGICGQRRWQNLELPPVRPGTTPELESHFARLAEAQELFRLTGGTHAAGIFDVDGSMLAFAEDVGRHNAVDKVIGAIALNAPNGHCSRSNCLIVSGRIAHELVVKAWRAGIPAIAGVSAPTSAAVSQARQAGMLLYGFCRGARATCYTPAEARSDR
jgi:FdhD protein